MNRFSAALGIPAGVIIVASSFAHSLLGWPQLRAQLLEAQAPPDLVTGIAVGWHFGGAAMFAFGCIAIVLFVDSLKNRPAPPFPVRMTALTYTAFGAAAMLATGNLFFLIFVVPGLMLAAATAPSKRRDIP